MPPKLHLRKWRTQPGGVPLLLLHGLAGNSHWWDHAAPFLTDRCNPVGMDFRGHGDSEWQADGQYQPSQLVDDIESARKELGWDRFVLCGHSMGARAATVYAAENVAKLSGFIAVDFLPEPYEPTLRKFRALMRLKQPHYETEEDILRRFRLEPEGTLLGDAALRELARSSIRKSEKGFTWKFDWRVFGLRHGPVWDHLAMITCPSLVIRAEHSEVMTRATFERCAQALPHCQAVEVPGAYHHVPLDAPKATAAAISSFSSARL